MLHSMKDLEGFAIRATDGTVGHVKDFYFDDKSWAVRYLVVETGSWLSSRKVLISPIAVDHPDWGGRVMPVSITREQVKNSPDIDTDKPVSRQHEMQYLGYYGYPYYWAGNGLWGEGAYPGMLLMGLGEGGSDAAYRHAQAEDSRANTADEERRNADPHLRSCNALMTYHVEASDGGIGHVQGLLLDDDTWAIRYFVVDTSNWWLGHQVLVAPRWIHDISWADSTVSVNLTQQAVKDAPPYNSAVPLHRDQEMGLHRHHGRAGYWAEEVQFENPQYRIPKTQQSP
jgi:sporulation protein YlmC with PRC-barrel domain